MSSKTKILVLKLKEIIYTLIFVILGVILIVLLILIINGRTGKKSKAASASAMYSPGIYTASLTLSNNPADIEIVVDEERIKSINLVNTSEAVTTMYPLIHSSLDEISNQVIRNNSTKDITYTNDNKYTAIVLLNAINEALEKAYVTN